MISKILIMLVFIPALSFGQSGVTNQRLFDTISFIHDHYESKVRAFEKEPIVPGKIIFLGNSITEGGEWKKLFNDSTIINRGIGGDITFGVLKRLNDIIKRKPSGLFIKIGINDIAKDIPDTVIADNIRKIIQKVQSESPTTKIYLQSMLPLNPLYPGFPQHYDKPEHVIKTNEMLKGVAQICDIRFINLFPLFLDSTGLLDQQYTYDGLHLNQKGYKIWADYLKKEKLL